MEYLKARVSLCPIHAQETLRAHDVIITSLLRQNDVTTSFWRNDYVIIALCVHWEHNGQSSNAREASGLKFTKLNLKIPFGPRTIIIQHFVKDLLLGRLQYHWHQLLILKSLLEKCTKITMQ